MATQNKIKIQLEFFAILKDLLTDRIMIEVPDKIPISELKKILIKNYPQAEEILKFSRFARESEILADTFPLKENIRIYVLPPSSGG